MSATKEKKRNSTQQKMERTSMPRLPPIPKLMTTKDRFDNSPLLKYRRAEEVQSLLANKVLEKAKKTQYKTQDSLKEFPIKEDGPEMPDSMMSRERRIRTNYEFLKKCVNNSAVTPMADDWWDSILDHIPQHLVTAPSLEPSIQGLHDEVITDYEKSIKKSMVQYALVKPKVGGVGRR